jgi:hypothetical protein
MKWKFEISKHFKFFTQHYYRIGYLFTYDFFYCDLTENLFIFCIFIYNSNICLIFLLIDLMLTSICNSSFENFMQIFFPTISIFAFIQKFIILNNSKLFQYRGNKNFTTF